MQGEEILRYALNDRYCGFGFIKNLCALCVLCGEN